MLARFLLPLLFLLGAVPVMAQAPEGPYLPDLMKEDPAYVAAWKAMVAGEKLPAWVNKFTKTQAAVATQMTKVPVAAQP